MKPYKKPRTWHNQKYVNRMHLLPMSTFEMYVIKEALLSYIRSSEHRFHREALTYSINYVEFLDSCLVDCPPYYKLKL